MNQNEFNKNDLLFANIVLGLKGVPFNTTVLLINNVPQNTLDINYNLDGIKEHTQVVKISKSAISNIKFEQKVQMQNNHQPAKNNEMKSWLLSSAFFGGNPLLQLGGASFINSMMDSNDYDKVSFKGYFEIQFEVNINNISLKFILNTDNDPSEFIEELKK